MGQNSPMQSIKKHFRSIQQHIACVFKIKCSSKKHTQFIKSITGDNIDMDYDLFSDKDLCDGKSLEELALKARLLAHKGDILTAFSLFKSLVQQDPSSVDLWLGLGNSQLLLEKHTEAIDSFKCAVKLQQNNSLLWVSLAKAYHASGDSLNALRCANKALSLNDRFAEAHCLLGDIRRSTSDTELAKISYQRALKIDNNFIEALHGLVWMLLGHECDKEALSLLEGELALAPSAELYILKANVYAYLEEFAKQNVQPENLFHEGVEKFRQSHELWLNYGIYLRNVGKVQKAISTLDEALKIKPGDEYTEFHLSLCFLLQGHFQRAWSGYEHRRLSKVSHVRIPPVDQWCGQSLIEKSILIYSEQGIGDEIMFSSCVSMAIEQAKNVILECTDKLAPIFQRSFPQCIVVRKKNHTSFGKDINFEKLDYSIPIGSLPKLLLANEDWPGNLRSYLKADPKKVHRWRKKLSSLNGSFNIGISWRGGVRETRSKLRSISLPLLAGAFESFDVNLISLQYGDVDEDIESAQNQGFKIYNWKEAIDDYDETAALTASLDLVVSVQTAIVHLAGAMGCKVWALIPKGAEWRYGSENKKMAWYQDVTLIRQVVLGDWLGPIEQVKKNCVF